MTENEERVERELEEFRDLLVREVDVPLGMVARLEAAVRSDERTHDTPGWPVRIAIACVFYMMFGLWSSDAMTLPLAVLLGVIAIVYPWMAHGQPDLSHTRLPTV